MDLSDLAALIENQPQNFKENDSNIILNTCRIFEQEKEMAYVVFRDVEGTFMKRLIDLAHEKIYMIGRQSVNIPMKKQQKIFILLH